MGFRISARSLNVLRFRPYLTQLEERTVPSGVPTQWAVRGAGGGGALFSPQINPANPNEYFVSSDMSQVFRTTDAGASWNLVDFRELQGGHESRVQYTENPNILYSLDYTSVQGNDTVRPAISMDGGTNWTPTSSDPTGGGGYYLFADPADHNRLAVSDYNNLYYSANGGSSWTLKYTAPNDGNGLLVGGAFWDGSGIYFGTSRGLLASVNNGTSFAISGVGGLAGQSIISFAGAKQGGVTRFVAVSYPSSDTYAGLAGYENGGGGTIATLDLGASAWTVRSLPAGAWPFYAGMARTDVNTIYAAGGSSSGVPTVYKSSNGGATWQSVFQTTNNANIQTGWSGQGGDRGWSYGELAMGFTVAANDPNRIIITDYGFAHSSTDGGASWKALYVNPSDLNQAGANIQAGKPYSDSGLDNTTSWQVAWADASNIFLANSDIRGQISTNGGQTFGFGYTGHSRNSMYRIAMGSNGTLYGAASSVHDLYQSTYLTDSRIDGGNGAVLFSTNKGLTWQTLHDFGRVISWVAVDPNNPNRLYASMAHGTQGGIYVTNNLSAGATSIWTKLAVPPRTQGHAFNIVVLNDGTLVASFSGRRDTAGAFTASSGVFVSTDNGASWLDRSDAGMRYWTKDVVIDPHDPTQNTWYAGVFSGWGGAPNGLGGLYKTTNRGQTWTRVLNLDRVTSATFHPTDPNELYITTETAGLWYSGNIRAANPTFTQVGSYSFRQPERVFFNPYNVNEIWVTSFGGGVQVGTAGSPGSLQFGSPTYSMTEAGGSFTITVSRTGGSLGTVGVFYATTNGSASAPGDYLAASGSLSWADGDTAPKTITINVFNDGLTEGSETFGLALSNPTGGAVLGGGAVATATILDDDFLTPGPAARTYAVGSDAGRIATVSFFNANGTLRFTATPFGSSYSGGVRVATGDVTGDGIPDVVAAPNGRIKPTTRILNGATGVMLPQSLTVSSTNGVLKVAVGDVTGDGLADIVVAGDLRISVFRGGDFVKLTEIDLGRDPQFQGPIEIALGDVNRNGLADLAVTGQYGSGTRFSVFDGRSLSWGNPSYLFKPLALQGEGLQLAAGDVDGDGYADVALGSGAGSAARVTGYSGERLANARQLVPLFDFAPAGNEFGNGVRLGLRDVDGDGRADLMIGAGSGRGSKLKAYRAISLAPTGTPSSALDFDVFPGFPGGVFVG